MVKATVIYQKSIFIFSSFQYTERLQNLIIIFKPLFQFLEKRTKVNWTECRRKLNVSEQIRAIGNIGNSPGELLTERVMPINSSDVIYHLSISFKARTAVVWSKKALVNDRFPWNALPLLLQGYTSNKW